MKNKNFDVKIYHSSFCSYIINAKDQEEAIQKARKHKINNIELMNNLEPWKDADTVEKV
ncbi:hypothetical protein GW881_04630 [Candidatus Roizmanbacteria bacterium]|nr:hypothetical protein [Candidatus Roizmanbacteria bacterium]